MITLLFWSSLIFVFYAYAGYPLLLWAYSRVKRTEPCKGPVQPFVSVVIAAFNEERRIEERLSNIISQDYPAEKIEIIVVSDGSNDSTCAKARLYADRNVKLLELEVRQGKASAITHGVALAKGEIIVFADARQRFEPDAISQLAANFSDPRIGCVSGELVFYNDDKCRSKTEMGAYWKYEKWIRKNESLSGSVAGATGAIYAIRRKLFSALPAGTILDDVLIPLTIIKQGYRCIFDGAAVAYDSVSDNTAQEYRRKVRTLAGNWQLLSLRPELLMPARNPCWWRFLSHKVARLIVPFALLALLCSGAALTGKLYQAATAMQLLLYGMAFAGMIVPASRKLRLVNLCYFFMAMNTAALAGFWLWLTRRSGTAWKMESDIVHRRRGDSRLREVS